MHRVSILPLAFPAVEATWGRFSSPKNGPELVHEDMGGLLPTLTKESDDAFKEDC